MEINDFIKCVAEQYEEVDAQEFTPDTKFKTFEEWSSLTSLSIIAAVDDEFGVTLKGDDIRNATTIQDLFDAAKAKV
jgi:Acyl carrier protein